MPLTVIVARRQPDDKTSVVGKRIVDLPPKGVLLGGEYLFVKELILAL